MNSDNQAPCPSDAVNAGTVHLPTGHASRYAGLTVTRWCESWSRGGAVAPGSCRRLLPDLARGVAARTRRNRPVSPTQMEGMS